MRSLATAALALLCLTVAACEQKGAPPSAPPAAPPAPSIPAPSASDKAAAALASNAAAAQAIVNAPDRTAADKELDAGRKPAEMLMFFDLAPGMRVADLGAGSGYTTELVARAVGPTGKVWMQNTPSWIERFLKKPVEERLARPIMKNVTRVDAEFDAPLPADAKDLDAVTFHAVYHDTVWLKADRAKMNKAVFEALKPGGHYLIIDTSAKKGSGDKDAESLHRIDEDFVKAEVEKAGFKLESSSDFGRNPADTRDWSASPREAKEKRGSGDRFALKFVKPAGAAAAPPATPSAAPSAPAAAPTAPAAAPSAPAKAPEAPAPKK